VKPFGDHLRANQDIDLARPKRGQDPAHIIFAFERVGVHPLQADVGEELLECVLNFLRP
jgi:hypothetical protein